MALTPSKMLALGTVAPDFRLPDVISGSVIGLDQLEKSNGFLLMFVCNHCPYVKHIQEEMARLGNEYLEKGIGVAAISSNDIDAYPEDSPELMLELAKRWNYHFPYLYDESQTVAKAYEAVCTPEFYLFNKGRELVYRGQFDSSRPGNNIPVDGHDLRMALDDLIAGNPISEIQIPSVGCNIKWK